MFEPSAKGEFCATQETYSRKEKLGRKWAEINGRGEPDSAGEKCDDNQKLRLWVAGGTIEGSRRNATVSPS